ncbi:F-box protein [Streptomyces sp. NPDC057910]|uniref:F-box protein n=1 Tax=Streptomyces sp. NPDC057910 TaxID=3346278 RepID=UPI0036EDA9D7
MTEQPESGAELNGQAQDVWAIIAPALQDSDSPAGLPARAYQALQTWPAHNLPHDLWQEILALLPLEDQTRLAHTSHPMREIVEQMAPQALDPTAHTTPDFIRTIYTQTELDTSLRFGHWLAFIPGTGSDLTIGRGLAHVHGPGTLTAVTGGLVTALDDIHITTVTHGHVHAYDHATIEEVTGGHVEAREQATITTLTGGHATALEQATITTVTGGEVRVGDSAVVMHVSGGDLSATAQATITTVTGGEVRVGDSAVVMHVSGGDLSATGQSTISDVSGGDVLATGQSTIGGVSGGMVALSEDAVVTVVGGDAHIIARGNAQVIIEATADGAHVDAYDAASVTADSCTITVMVHGPDVTVTSNNGAVINHAY